MESEGFRNVCIVKVMNIESYLNLIRGDTLTDHRPFLKLHFGYSNEYCEYSYDRLNR